MHIRREGIVAVCRATASMSKIDDSEPEIYVDGSRIWWRWKAPLTVVSSTGFVPRFTMNRPTVSVSFETNATVDMQSVLPRGDVRKAF